MVDIEKLKTIRSKIADLNAWSHTTFTFQNQLVSHLALNAGQGDYVVELGCFHGGLTAQLAYVTDALGKSLYVVDIDRSMLDTAAKTVASAIGAVPKTTHFHLGDLAHFLTNNRPTGRPLLLYIDGDHRYDGVVADIRASLNANLPRPLTFAFHDFSLRYAAGSGLDVRVDEAIRDMLPDAILQPIGDLAGMSTILKCQPSTDGHYHRAGTPEGVLVTLPVTK